MGYKMEDKPTLFNEIRVLLSEKRTSLSVLRTGLALFTVPISVFTILTAASQYYNVNEVLFLFILLIGICVGLIILGGYLIFRSMRRVKRIDDKILKLKESIASSNL